MRLSLTHVVAATLASCVLSSSVEGQWAGGAAGAAPRFWGGTIETTEEERSFLPYRPTTFSARVLREGPGLGVGVRLGYFSAGMALEGADAVVVAKDIFTVYSMAPEVLLRLTTLGSASRLLLRTGPLLELWKALEEDAETRLGVHAAVALHVPLGGKLEAVVSAGAALISSPFSEAQLDPQFERRMLGRRSITAGLQYGL